MTVAGYFCENLPLSTANNDDKKAEVMPRTIPVRYSISLWVIMKIPTITKTPKTISYQIILRLKMMGSIMEAKKAPVENMANAMEILAALIAPKNVIQCSAMIIPAINKFKS